MAMSSVRVTYGLQRPAREAVPVMPTDERLARFGGTRVIYDDRRGGLPTAQPSTVPDDIRLSMVTAEPAGASVPVQPARPVSVEAVPSVAAEMLPADVSVTDLPEPQAPVTFTPFVFRLWDRYSSEKTPLDLASDPAVPKILRGRYIFTFNIGKGLQLPVMQMARPLPVTVEGKQTVIEKYRYDPETGRARFQINVLQNPIWLIAVAAAIAGAGVLAAGWGVEKALESVDKVVVDLPKASGKTILYVLGGVAGAKLLGVI